jgi:hypothetical protein
MTFALTNNPTQSEVSEAINYLLANFGSNLIADNTTGIITGPSGVIIAYLYQYLSVKYADSFDGSVNFSNSPTNRQYYGLRNTNSSVESSDYADYIWYQAAGGFGTTKFLFYQTSGGRQINFFVGTTAPDATYLQESGPAIDLDFLTTTTTIAYNAAAPSIFKWTASSTPPARPSTTSTYTWATGAYTAPAGWSTTQPIDTTAGSYLWAITIPLVVLSTTVTSTLDWTNTSYAIYVAGSNGATGPTGGTGTAGVNGLAAITAYRVQSQSSAAPATPSNTTGPTAPAGWFLTAPAVTVGDVLWYSFGQYNSSSGTISGIPAGQTQWGTPTAASVFQDIRSDNWNGSNPPVFGTPGTYGTAGYYIQRNTGDVFFNNGIFRANISTSGDAVFSGDNTTTSTIFVYDSFYYIDYSTLGQATTNASLGNVRAGVLGKADSTGSIVNAGVIGYGDNPSSVVGGLGIGVLGSGYHFGGAFSSQTTAGIGLSTTAQTGTGTAFNIGIGQFRWNGYSIPQPAGSTTTFLRNDGTWATPSASSGVTSLATSNSSSGLTLSASASTGAVTLSLAGTPLNSDNLGGFSGSQYARIFATNSGTANAGGSGINILGSGTTGIVGAYVATSGTSNIVTIEVTTTSPSDVRLKEEISNSDLGLDFVKKLRPVSYKLKADPKHQKGYGFIADEVDQLIESGSSLVYYEPDWKVGDEKGFKTIHYPSYIAVLTKAIQELSAQVETLKAQIKV